jgi:histone acetyltransferase (RNA polymerase elongator complex component)
LISQKNAPTGPSQAELLLRVTSGIAAELIKAYDANESVSLNEIRAKLSKKHGFGGVPRLVDIISAIPDDYKKALLPKLKARPVRTASGVSFAFFLFWWMKGENICLSILCRLCEDCGRCCHVQTPSMSTYCDDRKYLRVCA